MDFNFSPEEEAFRAEVRTFIEENKPESFDAYGGRDQRRRRSARRIVTI